MNSGYVITRDERVLDWVGENGVRYAAHCANGDGFAAFDADGPDLFELAQRGRILVAAFPWWRMPKRGIATGEETFTLLRPTISAEALMDEVERFWCREVIVVENGSPFVLVETGRYVPEFSHGEVVWSGVTRSYRDVRIEVPA